MYSLAEVDSSDTLAEHSLSGLRTLPMLVNRPLLIILFALQFD